MFWPFFVLVMFCGAVGVVAWLVSQRVLSHMRDNPEAAKLISEHVITPLLTGKKKPEGKKEAEDPKRTKGTII